MWRISAILFSIIILFFNLVNGEQDVPCYFIFGDSLSDAGINNGLITMAKANYTPYGVDFPEKIPTGRFTNGRTAVDFISQFLGFQRFITPYSSDSTQMDQDILRGVNYASGSAGVLVETGSHLGDRVWMDRQLQYYGMTISKLQSLIQGSVDKYLNKCLYTVNIGSNDYINNYFMPEHYPTKTLFTPGQYAELLIGQYKSQLQTLYSSGARKVAVFGLGKIGCVPAEMVMNNATECVEEINQAVDLFNTKLVSLVDYFNAKFDGAKFTFINVSAMQSLDRILPGFITRSTCCKLRSDFQCEPLTPPCTNRNLHAFMDGFHPTEVVNKLVATMAFYTPFPLSLVHPMSISKLIRS